MGSFVDKIIKRRSTAATLPYPSTKSCYEQSAKKGGGLCVLADYGIAPPEEMREQQLEERAENIYGAAIEAGLPWGDAEVLDIYDLMERTGPEGFKHIFYDDAFETQRSYHETFLAATKDAINHRVAKILPIIQPDGKIRIATLHHSTVLWAARAMTAHLLPHLKRITFSRNMLRNEKVLLKNPNPNAIVYSADLSKSTDPISIPLARWVLNRIVEKIGRPVWWNQAMNAVITVHKLEYEDQLFSTVCGALMGLGPGWTVLSILNAFCAEDAGAQRGSYAVCGDDLLGFWSESVCDRYERNLQLAGLVANRDKSFRSPTHGVFCERLATRKGQEVQALPCIRIGEACGSRALDGNQGIAVVDHLYRLSQRDPAGYQKTHRILRKMAKRVAVRLAIAPGLAGSLSCGGGGCSKPNALTVLMYYKFGPTPITRAAYDPRITSLRQQLRTAKPKVHGVVAEDVLIEGRAQVEAEWRLLDKTRLPTGGLLKYRDVRKGLFMRQRQVKKAIRQHHGILNTIERETSYALVTPTLKRNVCHALRRRRWGTALNLLQRSWSRTVDESDVHSQPSD